MAIQKWTVVTLGALCLATTSAVASPGQVPMTAAFVDGAVPIGSTNVHLTGPVTWTAVSGDTGSFSKIIGTNSDDAAVYSIRWWEAFDDPCKFRAYKRHLDDADDVREPEREFCNGAPGNEKWAQRRGANEYITAIKVCRNDKNDSTREKIKGLQVWGSTIDKSTATLGPQNGPDEDKHNNCKVWRQKVSCPAGQVASKIKVHYNTYSGYETDPGFANGISLGCRALARG